MVFFMRPKDEEATQLFLSQLKTAPVDQAVVNAAGALYRKWHLDHGIDINDALLAATAMLTEGRIFCLNAKHCPMLEMLVKKAW